MRVLIEAKHLEFRLNGDTQRAEVITYWPSREIKDHWAGTLDQLITILLEIKHG